jgi:TPP-dependent pyruvate/acetoin dehydrogenase alpha subunit
MASNGRWRHEMSGEHERDLAWRALLEAMLRVRRFDEALIAHADQIDGVYHVSIGLEATAGALALARREGDTTMLNHRNHGALSALGSDMESMFREIFGRDGGPQRGRAGTLHLADPSVGVPYTSAMVGGGVALAVGVAFARRLAGEGGIVFAFFGDGAMGEGAVYESFNLARLWEAPVLFVCESNSESGAERANDNQAAASLAALAEVHQMAATAVDASDPVAVAEVFLAEAAAVRAGGGPRFLEARSAPWPGNAGFMPDPQARRFDLASAVRGPGEGWDALDPLGQMVRWAVAEGAELAELEALDAAVCAEIKRAAETATAAPIAPRSAATENVWGP